MRPKIISVLFAILGLAPAVTILPTPAAAADEQVVRVDGLVQWSGPRARGRRQAARTV